MLVIDNSLIENKPDFTDWFRVLGAINLRTGEYTESKYLIGHNPNKITSISALEEFANKIYSKERFDSVKSDLERYLKSDLYYCAMSACKLLDGMSYAKSMGFPKWKATDKDAFAIYDGYYDYNGITDWRSIIDQPESDWEPRDTYAVIVDFHS